MKSYIMKSYIKNSNRRSLSLPSKTRRLKKSNRRSLSLPSKTRRLKKSNSRSLSAPIKITTKSKPKSINNTRKSILTRLPKELLDKTLSYIKKNDAPPIHQPAVHFLNNIEGNYDAVTPIDISKLKTKTYNNFDIVINTRKNNSQGESIYFYKDNFIYPSVGYPHDEGSIPPWVNIKKSDCGYSYFNEFINFNTGITYSLSNKFTPFIKNYWNLLDGKIEIVKNNKEVNNYYNNFNYYDNEYDEQYSDDEYDKLFVKKTITRDQDKAKAYIYHPVYVNKKIDIKKNNNKKIILDKVNSMIKKYVEIEERDYYYEDDEHYINSIYLEAFDTCKFKLRQTKWNINSGEYEKFNPIIYN